jgi:RimJ/RimL family protein N-acetyltransferase/ribosomal protein S18 acetylase RimI-like enzyme
VFGLDRGHVAKIGAVPVERIRDFRRRLQRAAAEVEVETPHGVALLAPSIRDVYDANYLSVEEATVPAAELAAEAEVSLEDHFHRRVIVEQGTPGVAADFERLGFGLATHLVLAHEASLDRRVDTSMVREVSLDDLAAVRHATTVAEPWGDDEIARQLDGAKRLIAAAVPTRFFAAYVDGEVAAYCEVRSAGGTAQIEDVETVDRFRGRGLGRAIVQHALEQALRDHDVVFLEALADDWPRELYAKLGFRVVDRRDFYTRLPHPSTRLRLRTPRLVLRRATIAELRELYRVAAAGVHDPAEMPFEVPWTDNLNEPDFLAHLTEETGHDLRLVVFHEGKPIGVQAVDVRLPRVSTGSWLGASYQSRGFGTEMRTAVLAFAFDHLRAEVAVSGAVAGNDRSLGVSRKLGYRVTGAHDVSPRGEPVEHTDVELRREDFRPPVPVQVEGAAQVLPLFDS